MVDSWVIEREERERLVKRKKLSEVIRGAWAAWEARRARVLATLEGA